MGKERMNNPVEGSGVEDACASSTVMTSPASDGALERSRATVKVAPEKKVERLPELSLSVIKKEAGVTSPENVALTMLRESSNRKELFWSSPTLSP
jgi:hypothetical protein